jgi:mono/diheme cytochrome c family protein
MSQTIAYAAGVLLVLAAVIATSCQNENTIEFNRYYSSGSLIYKNNCQNCHSANGEGLQRLIPPLTDTAYLKTNKSLTGCGVKYGLKGKITVSGREFEGVMPANDLAPLEIAEVLTYINNSFGNKLGITTLQQANNDLLKCR